MKQLVLENLAGQIERMTSEVIDFFAQAAKVSLINQNHVSGVQLQIQGEIEESVQIKWNENKDSRLKPSWGDLEVATEYGAYGIAMYIIAEFTEYVVIERSVKGTGFDFWLGKREEEKNFQNKLCLEVSGIAKGTPGQINARVKEKIAQTEQSSEIPAYIVVVEFGTPLSKVETR